MNLETELSAAAAIQIRTTLLTVPTPPLPARKFPLKLTPWVHTDLGLPSRNYRRVTQALHPREKPLVRHTWYCHWKGKKMVVKDTPEAAPLKMCQQYILFYPEVVKKPEIFKTGAIF